MSVESLQPIELSSSGQEIEMFLEQFEVDYPDMLVEVINIKSVLNEMPTGELNEV